MKVGLVAWTVYMLVTVPWQFLLGVGVVYLISLPMGPVAYHMLLSDHHK